MGKSGGGEEVLKECSEMEGEIWLEESNRGRCAVAFRMSVILHLC